MTAETVGARQWYDQFRRTVRGHEWADALREAALAGRRGDWTKHLTGAVAGTCAALGWKASGLGHPSELLPVPKQEYLGIDVMAFAGGQQPGWQRPVAAFELENRPEIEIVSYSLWKVSLLRCPLVAVFCYRKEEEQIGGLVQELGRGVMAQVRGRGEEGGELLLVVGTRAKADSFPDGFFRPYVWEADAQRFRRLL